MVWPFRNRRLDAVEASIRSLINRADGHKAALASLQTRVDLAVENSGRRHDGHAKRLGEIEDVLPRFRDAIRSMTTEIDRLKGELQSLQDAPAVTEPAPKTDRRPTQYDAPILGERPDKGLVNAKDILYWLRTPPKSDLPFFPRHVEVKRRGSQTLYFWRADDVQTWLDWSEEHFCVRRPPLTYYMVKGIPHHYMRARARYYRREIIDALVNAVEAGEIKKPAEVYHRYSQILRTLQPVPSPWLVVKTAEELDLRSPTADE